MKLEERAAQIIKWPSSKYAGNPSAFCSEILGIEPWSKQADILQALTRKNEWGIPSARVAVRSCNGVGKTRIAGAAALWWHALYPDAQVICSAPVKRQVRDQLWKAIRELHGDSGVCVNCRREKFPGRQCEHSTRLDGKVPSDPETGLILGDVHQRILKGFVAVSKNTAVGYEGVDQLWIGDEAAGLKGDWFEAAQAAMKGGGSILIIGNPSEITGFHADAFLKAPKAGQPSYWTDTFTISALESPNVKTGRILIRGMTTLEWVNNCRLLWGENSDLYRIRVLGLHPEHVRGMLVSFGEMALMHARWEPDQKPPTEDGLWIGLDVAAFDRSVEGYTVQGSSGLAGDKWVASVVRGDYCCEIQKWQTMTRPELILRLGDLARKWRAYPNEPVTLRYDAEGSGGVECQRVLELAEADSRSGIADWQIEGVKVSMRMPQQTQDGRDRFGTVRDAGYANLAEWIKRDGAVPPDDELDDELAHTVWMDDPHGGRDRIIPKKEIKEKLEHHRSPDTLESLMLAIWNGRVITYTDRETEAQEGFEPLWMRGASSVPKAKYDPGVRGSRRRMM